MNLSPEEARMILDLLETATLSPLDANQATLLAHLADRASEIPPPDLPEEIGQP